MTTRLSSFLMTYCAAMASVMVLFFLPLEPALAQSPESEAVPPAEETALEARPRYLTQPIREVRGPRRTVAVGGFDAVGSFTSVYGDWDIGGGLAAMLTSALVESERFIVVERSRLDEVLTEQELSAARITASDQVATAGRLAGVQLLVYGAVTEFETREKGSGLSIGIGRSFWRDGASRQKTEGAIAMDIRIVDTATGEIVETHQVEEQITATGFDLSVGYQGVSIGDNEFVKTPLGEAARGAITEAVDLIAQNADERPWNGLVVEYDGNALYINAGERSGIAPGDVFRIERIVQRLTDPQTGEVLLVRKNTLGQVAITDVTEKLSFGMYSAAAGETPKRGDRAVLVSTEQAGSNPNQR